MSGVVKKHYDFNIHYIMQVPSSMVDNISRRPILTSITPASRKFAHCMLSLKVNNIFKKTIFAINRVIELKVATSGDALYIEYNNNTCALISEILIKCYPFFLFMITIDKRHPACVKKVANQLYLCHGTPIRMCEKRCL